MTEPEHGGTQLSLLDQHAVQWLHTSGLSLRVRQSGRARRLILHVVPPGMLEVVVPRGVKARTVESFVRENHAWITAARRALGADAAVDATRLPDRIELAAIGLGFGIHYRIADRNSLVEAGPAELIVQHDGTLATAADLLRRWLLGRARKVLKPWLAREAQRLDVAPAAVQVRLQRTRWGSCSSQRRVSLNAALLLVDADLVRYLLVHELCHLTHMNHSSRFWASVRRFEPAYEAADRRLGEAWKRLPAWVFDAGGGR